MNYKRMWLSLKKIVEEEADIFCGYSDYEIAEKTECFKGQAEEADYILAELKIIEVRELFLQEKEKMRGKNEDH